MALDDPGGQRPVRLRRELRGSRTWRSSGETTLRDDSATVSGISGVLGTGSRITNVWIEHFTTGAWIGVNGNTPTSGHVVHGAPIRDTIADGNNFANGTSDSTIEQSSARNTGDDGFASWAFAGAGDPPNTGNVFRFDTVQAPWRANCFAIYGGTGNAVEDSVCADVVTYPGILVDQEFDSHPFAGTTSIARDTIVRSGGSMFGIEWGALTVSGHDSAAPITGVVIQDVDIEDSTYAGLLFIGPSDSIDGVSADQPGRSPGPAPTALAVAAKARRDRRRRRAWSRPPGRRGSQQRGRRLDVHAANRRHGMSDSGQSRLQGGWLVLAIRDRRGVRRIERVERLQRRALHRGRGRRSPGRKREYAADLRSEGRRVRRWRGSAAAPVVPTGPVTDFPAPILDGTAPPSSQTLFGPTTQGASSGGPCLVEPESDVLYPQNWLRPRFTWTAANGETLFELRLHVANQLSDLCRLHDEHDLQTMPQATWDALRAHSPTEAMTLTIRGGVLSGATLQGEALGSQTTMGIAPVQATGAIVYWTTNDGTTGTSALKGFSPGDETVEKVLEPSQYAQAQGTTSQCIGCHTSAPDGEFVAFTTTTSAEQQWSDALALIDPDAGTVGSAPSYVSPSGAQALARPNVGAVAFSPAHWSTGDRRAVVSYDNGNSASNIVLSWIDLEATSAAQASGTLARTGDTQLAGAPAWSHDGNTVAYVSTNRVCTGRLGNCTPQYTDPADVGSRADLYTVPYAGGAGGTATPVPGASDPSVQEYYPSFSPDDKWLVFNRIPNDDEPVRPAGRRGLRHPPRERRDGEPVSPPTIPPRAARGMTSPGLTNSWGHWGPTALQGERGIRTTGSSSARSAPARCRSSTSRRSSKGADGTPLTTHGAPHYLWNQPATESETTRRPGTRSRCRRFPPPH